MKKSYLMIAAAAALFAACSSNDTFKEVDVQDVAIGFSGEYVAKTTKAIITTAWMSQADSDLNGDPVNESNKFGVYGYKKESTEKTLFANERVYWKANITTPDWYHPTVRYWDKGASDAYDFYAYAPYSNTEGVVTFNRTAVSEKTGFVYSLGTQVFANAADAATIDLCVARKINTDYAECSDSHVSFTFEHVLSLLDFNIKKSSSLANNEVKLQSINIAIPQGTGFKWTQTAMNADAGVISHTTLTQPEESSTKSEVVVTGSTQVINVSSNAITGAKSYIVTPNISDQEKHTIQMEVKYSIEYEDHTIDNQTATGSVSFQYQQDYHYTLTITINPATIEFDVDAVNGFQTASAQDIEVR